MLKSIITQALNNLGYSFTDNFGYLIEPNLEGVKGARARPKLYHGCSDRKREGSRRAQGEAGSRSGGTQ